jgi:hypothetical protein
MDYEILYNGNSVGTTPKHLVAYNVIKCMKDNLNMTPSQINSALRDHRYFWSTQNDTRFTDELDFGNGKYFVCTKKRQPDFLFQSLIADINKLGLVVVPVTPTQNNDTDFYYSVNAADFIHENSLQLPKNSVTTFNGNIGKSGIEPYDWWKCKHTRGIQFLRNPDLCLNYINKFIVAAKNVAEMGKKTVRRANGNFCPANFTTYLVKNIPVVLVTEEDAGYDLRTIYPRYNEFRYPIPFLRNKDLVVPFPNLKHANEGSRLRTREFTRNQEPNILESIPVPKPCSLDEGSTCTEALGMYLPNDGIIFIWIDRIMKCAQYHCTHFGFYEEIGYTNPIIAQALRLFQEVLLHEFFHAFFDIQWDGKQYLSGNYNPNYKSSVNINGQSITISEETIDNALVLLTYYKFAPRQQFDIVYNFLVSQPQYYREAVDLYQPTNDFHPSSSFYDIVRVELIKLLETK